MYLLANASFFVFSITVPHRFTTVPLNSLNWREKCLILAILLFTPQMKSNSFQKQKHRSDNTLNCTYVKHGHRSFFIGS